MTSQTPPTGPPSTPPSPDQKWYKKGIEKARAAAKVILGMSPEKGWEAVEAARVSAVKAGWAPDWKAIETFDKAPGSPNLLAKVMKRDQPAPTPIAAPDASAPDAKAQVEISSGPQKGLAVFEEILKESPNSQPLTSERNIGILINLLRQDAQHSFDPDNSLLRRLGFDAENLEHILQCAFRESIDSVSSRIRSDKSPGEMVLEGILNYSKPKNLTKAEILETESKKREPFAELIDALKPFHQFSRQGGLENISKLTPYLTKHNESIQDLQNEMTADPNLIATLQGEIAGIELEVRQKRQERIDPKDPIAVARLMKFGVEKKSQIEKLTDKIEAIKAFKNLALNQPKNPVKFDESAITARLQQLKLVRREVPQDYEWEPVLGDSGTAFYLNLMEGVRTQFVRDKDTDVIAAINEVDPDQSLWRDFIDEPSKPIEVLIYENCFDESVMKMNGGVPPNMIKNKIKELALAIGKGLASKKTNEGGQALAFMARQPKTTPTAIEKALANNPNLIAEWEAFKDAPENITKKAELEAFIGVLKFFQVFVERKKGITEAQTRKQVWEGLRQDVDLRLQLELIDQVREELKSGAMTKDQFEASLSSFPSDGHFVDAMITSSRPTEELILKHFPDLRQNTPDLRDRLARRIQEIQTALST